MQAMVKTQEFECQFCFKTFVKESSLMAHSCAKKMRWLDKDNKHVAIGFTAWKRFYQLTKSAGKTKTYKDFVDSKYYNDFVSFGMWINDSAIVQPNAYIDYVIKGNFKLKDWTKNSVYDGYLKNTLIKEDPTDALERSIVWIQEWCNQQNVPIEKFFDTISTNKLVDVLRAGRISPWLLFVCSQPEIAFDKFDNSQMKLLDSLLDPKIWNLKLRKYQKEIKEYKELIRSMGL